VTSAVGIEARVDERLVVAAERIEREAFRDMFLAAPSDLASRLGIETAEVGGATCTIAAGLDVGVRMFNRAIGLGLDGPVSADDLDAIARWFDGRGVDLHVQVAPLAVNAGLEPVLEGSGFEPSYRWMKFVRGLEPPPDVASTIEVRPLEPDECDLFGQLVATGFGLPAGVGEWLAPIAGRAGWRCYLALDDGRPAGAAGMYLSAGAVWFGFGTVLPAYRGKGVQRAFFAARIRDALELGAELLVTETGERVAAKPDYSYANMLASGFQEVYLRASFVRHAS
jgi:GNAT superfamily N-acetyltransferase